MAGDGEGVHTHAHGFRGDGTKLLPVWTVFVDGLHLGGADCPWAHASQSCKLLGVGVHSVNAPELAAGITEEDEEVIGGTLLHLLKFKEGKSTRKKSEKHHIGFIIGFSFLLVPINAEISSEYNSQQDLND